MKQILPNFSPKKNLGWLEKIVVLSAIFALPLTTTAQLNVVLNSQGPICGGFSTGHITALPSNGTPPYSYQWSNGATSNPITLLPIGPYSVTVTDAFGETGTAAATLTSPPILNADIDVTTCAVPGSMTATANGGAAPYMYMWDNGAVGQTISNLSPGEYCVTVMDANSCGYVTCEFVGPPVSVNVTATPLDCASSTGGTVAANVTGGLSPITYLWSNGATTSSISNLLTGTYTVTVTSNNGCTASASGTVTMTMASFDLNLNVMNPTCTGGSDGSITANVMGGLAPISYNWSNGATTQTISNLTPGTYSLTITDALGCTSATSRTLFYQSNVNVNVNGTNPICAGANNGSVSATPSGGISPYSYLWSNGATTQTLNNLSAGNYSVTVTDAIGCTSTGSTTLTAPTNFTVSVSSTNASNCGASNGTASATPMGGGSPPFSYMWSNGATTSTVNGLPAGTYSVTVTSSQGCAASGSVFVGQPNTLLVNINGTNLVCGNDTDGMLNANVTYGTPPYQFNWSNGATTQNIQNLSAGTYSVTVTSSEGCMGTASATINGTPQIGANLNAQNLNCFANNSGQITANAFGGTLPLSYLWSNGGTSSTISNLAAGPYSLTITDASGCTFAASADVTQPTDIQVFINANGSCGTNGSASANVSGGTPGYTYSWSTGATSTSISGLAPGNYSLTVTDANGCTKTQSTTVIAFPLVALNVTSTNTTCNGTSDGTATANVSNGTAPFTYAWSNGANTQTITNLGPGTYSVTVTDANGCQAFGSASVALGAGLNVSINAPAYACPGQPVSATAMATGGTPNYSYLWSNGQAAQSATGLTAGTYSVTVTDPSSCSGSASVTILPGGDFNVNSTAENLACFGEADGSITLNVSGGSTPYNYAWSNGASTSAIQNLAADPYSVTVSDQTGCSQTLNFNLTQPPVLTLSASGQNGTCGSLGSASANAGGGTPGYLFAWSNGGAGQSITNLPAGTYTVTVTDANGCTEAASTNVQVIAPPSCVVALTQPITTLNGNNGQLTAQVSGGTAPFSFLWSNGQNAATVSNLPAGTYSVTVTDANNCQTMCSFTLLNPAKLGDFVWLDLDEDGIQDVGEPGFGNVNATVTGTDTYGNSVSMSTSTDATGMYMFLVQPGTYKVTFSIPTDFVVTTANAGSNDAIDSDVNPMTNMTPFYTVGPGEENPTIDLGLYEAPCENVTDPGTICCDQTLCGPGLIPDPFFETSPATGGVGAIEYLWMYSTVPGPFNPGSWIAIEDATSPGYAPGPISETTFFVRCVRREGCSMYLESNQIVITVDDDAVAEINGPNFACVGDNVNFFATANGPGATYAWTFGGGNPPSANTQAVTGVSWNSFGVKTITLTVENNGCTSHDELLINVSNSPVVCGNALVINGEAESLTEVMIDWEYPEAGIEGLAFEVLWGMEDGEFTSLGAPDLSRTSGSGWHFEKRHDAPEKGSNFYQVKVTDEMGETTESNTVEVMIMRSGFRLVDVYPNPFNEVLNLDVKDRLDESITLEFFDSFGRLAKIYRVPDEGAHFEISTDELARGTYFVFARYGSSAQKIFKLVK